MIEIKRFGTPRIKGWVLGEKVKNVCTLKEGDMMLVVSHKFDSQNICRVTTVDGFPFGELVQAFFVNPMAPTMRRSSGDTELGIWQHDLTGLDKEYFLVYQEGVNALSGADIRRMMRQHKVKMRDLKAKFQVTLKRIREVRLKGVTGFSADEWTFLITGAWPDKKSKASP
jgi:hypothetical protein